MCSVTKCVYIPLNTQCAMELVWSLDHCWAQKLSFSKYHFLPLHVDFFFLLMGKQESIPNWDMRLQRLIWQFPTWRWFPVWVQEWKRREIKDSWEANLLYFLFFYWGGGCLVSLSPVSHIDDILAFCSLLIIAFSINTISFIPLCLEQHMGS